MEGLIMYIAWSDMHEDMQLIVRKVQKLALDGFLTFYIAAIWTLTE